VRRFIRDCLISAAALAATTAPAITHPHVFAEARLDVVVAPDGKVTALRHLWRFDDLFSSTVLIEFDANRDNQLDETELAEVGNVIFQSLAEFDYFQVVNANDKSVKMKAPPRIVADYQDNQFIILFESEPVEPLQLTGKVSFGVYDPTFYTAIDFLEDEYLAVEGLPSGCAQAVVRPDPDEAISQNQDWLTDEFFNDPSGNDMGSIFATRLEVTCSANG
jgi:ABC-type uncharacterized transport system substrate-binding protein